MGFREKVAWGALIAELVVFGLYFASFATHWNARIASADRGIGQMIGATLALIVLSIVVAIITTLGTRRGDVRSTYDEREKLIRLRAANIAAAVVTVGAFLAIVALLLGWNAVLVANLLLAVLVVAEIVKAIAQIVQFRTFA